MTFPSSFWRLFFEQAKPYWKRFVLLYAVSIGSEISLLFMPVMMKGFLNAMTQHVDVTEVGRWLAYAMVARLGGSLLGRLSFPLERGLSTKLQMQLEGVAVRRTLDQSYRFFTDMPSGQLLTKIQKLGSAYDRLHSIILQTYLPAAINFLFLLVLGFTRAPAMAAIAVGFGVVSTVMAWWKSRALKPADRVITEARSRLTGTLADILGQGVTVLFFGAQKREAKNYQKHANELLKAWRVRWMGNWRMMNYQRTLSVAFEFSVLGIVFLGWRDGQMTVGDVVMYQGVVALLLSQVRSFHDSIRQWHDATFKDDGCGMNERTKAKAFNPFFTTKEVGKGMGLGLSLSFGILSKIRLGEVGGIVRTRLFELGIL
jgi:ABC-type multidrug transport system fused ATPase/permease subunit